MAGLSHSRWAPQWAHRISDPAPPHASRTHRTHHYSTAPTVDVAPVTYYYQEAWTPPPTINNPLGAGSGVGSGIGSGSSNQSVKRVVLDPARARFELSRYTKIVRRLKWKLPYLAVGYGQATAVRNVEPGTTVDEGDRARAAEAELMFKLDFFEFYMLLERALVHMLSAFGITVERGSVNYGGAGLARSVFAQHRYHANVLEALDRQENPLHAVLGTGDVRRQLARAKDLRNRWKNADEAAATEGGRRNGNRFVDAPLETYDLERILATIFDGFDRAFILAQEHLAGGRGPGGATAATGSTTAPVPVREIEMDLSGTDGTEEEQWEFIVDAMDWEAI